MRETKSNSQIINELVDRFDVIPDAVLSDYTSFQVGGRTPALIQCGTLNDLVETICYLNQKQISFLVIGQGTNLLVSDKGVDQIIVRFCNEEDSSIKQVDEIITVGGEILLDQLVVRSIELGLGDLGYLSGIPGTVGGAIVGNAGAFGEQIGDVLQRAELLSYTGIRRWVSHDELRFAYRSSALKESEEILLQAELKVTQVDKVDAEKRRNEILKLRREKHPNWKTEPCAGSVFRNIEPTSSAGRRQAAGWFLEEAGAKLFSQGNASIYAKHANIIIAEAGASATDVYRLSEKMKQAVKETFNLNLHREIRLVGEFPEE
jgi:UDP-N-acetylmuramate dehydrogenase